MKKIHVIELTETERASLQQITRRGHGSARELRRAHLLLLADEGKTDSEIASALHINPQTAYNTRRRFCHQNAGAINDPSETVTITARLKDRPRPGQKPKLNGHQEALLTALACSEAPDGRSRWTLRLLADRFVALGEHTPPSDGVEGAEPLPTISYETVRRVLKKAI